MYQIAKPLFLYCETPMHAGSGSELGVIDLPIQRERHTGFPKIESSSLKGALRERFEEVMIRRGEISSDDKKRSHPQIYASFGPDGDEGDLYAGALGFTDARLLLFPVKSMKGVFAWISCRQVLKRLQQDLEQCGVNMGFNLDEINYPTQGKALITNESHVTVNDSHVILEEYAFACQKDESVTNLSNWLINNVLGKNTAWMEKIFGSLVILHDEDFKDFVELSTDVITRTKIDNLTGTVAKGALFTEEYLPADSLMYALVLAAPVFNAADKKANLDTAAEVIDFFKNTLEADHFNNRFQLGGNSTLGKGIIQTSLIP
jgi:CRISPR-associated protein Cmr4